jgi:hypothetical protein
LYFVQKQAQFATSILFDQSFKDRMAANIRPKLQEFKGEEGDNFDVWFKRFELFVPAGGANARHDVLPLYLAGRAFITYDALTAAEKANYALLKAALRGRLVPGDHALLRRQEVMGMTRRLDESLPSFELRIMEAVTIAYADFPADARGALAKEQFIRGIENGDIQLHLLTHNPVTLRDAVQLAQQYEQVRKIADVHSIRGVQGGATAAKEYGSGADSTVLKDLATQVRKLSEEMKEMRMEQKVQRQQVTQRHPPDQLGSGSATDPNDSYQPGAGRGRGRFRTKPNFARGRDPSRGQQWQQEKNHQAANEWPQGALQAQEFVPRRGNNQQAPSGGQPKQKFEGLCDYCKTKGHKWRNCWFLTHDQGE